MLGWKLFGLVGALWLAAPATAEAQAAAPAAGAEPRTAVWLLSDDDTRIYLFGTAHILPRGLRWRPAALDRAIADARELVLEVSDEEMASTDLETLAPTPLAEPVPVLDRVSADRRAALGRLLAELEIGEGTLDRMETWTVALILGVAQMTHDPSRDRMGLARLGEGVVSVEETLAAEFRANDRPVTGVETVADQIAAFRLLPARVQQAMLEELVDSYANGDDAGDPIEADWVSGNLEGIAAETETLPPELFETLVTQRNRRFADWLAARLDRPGTVLFAVGAGHFAGRVSVQSMLESRGLRVTRLN